MAISLRILSPNTNLRPKLACEITPEGVIAARQSEKQEAVMAFAPLPAGSVVPGLKIPNIVDQPAVVAALRKALDEVSTRENKLTLVIPDAAVRVLLLDFDTLPAKAQETLPVVRFRLRKLTPFEVDDAAVSYQILRQTKDQIRVLVIVMPAEIRAEYESAVRAAAYEPGVVLPSTIASLAALTSSDTALVIHRNGLSVTTAITQGDELLLHRTIDLPENEALHREELVQTVSVAQAYFEDTLNMAPQSIYYVGPGGAAEFAHLLGPEAEEQGPRVRDLVGIGSLGAVNVIPRGVAAGVVGALAS